MSWVLYTNALAGRRYLRDYRRGEELIWTPVVEKAEKFTGAEEAITMARRLSFILGERVEALSMPQDAPGETCTTLHCGCPVEPGRMHCGAHSKPSVTRREPLSNNQIDEAALHQAVEVMAEDDVDEELEKLLEDGPHHADCDHLGGDCRVLRRHKAERAHAMESVTDLVWDEHKRSFDCVNRANGATP